MSFGVYHFSQIGLRSKVRSKYENTRTESKSN